MLQKLLLEPIVMLQKKVRPASFHLQVYYLSVYCQFVYYLIISKLLFTKAVKASPFNKF